MSLCVTRPTQREATDGPFHDVRGVFSQFSNMAEFKESCVVLTDKIRRWIKCELSSEFMSQDNKRQLEKYVKTPEAANRKMPEVIPFRLVKALHKCLQEEQGEHRFRFTSVLFDHDLKLQTPFIYMSMIKDRSI